MAATSDVIWGEPVTTYRGRHLDGSGSAVPACWTITIRDGEQAMCAPMWATIRARLLAGVGISDWVERGVDLVATDEDAEIVLEDAAACRRAAEGAA